MKKKIINIFIRLVRKNYWIFLFFCSSGGYAPLNKIAKHVFEYIHYPNYRYSDLGPISISSNNRDSTVVKFWLQISKWVRRWHPCEIYNGLQLGRLFLSSFNSSAWTLARILSLYNFLMQDAQLNFDFVSVYHKSTERTV